MYKAPSPVSEASPAPVVKDAAKEITAPQEQLYVAKSKIEAKAEPKIPPVETNKKPATEEFDTLYRPAAKTGENKDMDSALPETKKEEFVFYKSKTDMAKHSE